MENKIIEGTIIEIYIDGQIYNALVDKIDHEGIHAPPYLIVPKDNTWVIKNYPFPHEINFKTIHNECKFFATTSQFGNIKNNKIHYSGVKNLKELQIEAINRNIDIDDSFQNICNNIQKQLPSLEWQKQNLLDTSNRNLVSKEEFDDVYNYQNYSFSSMNYELRRNPNLEAPINNTIDKMKPLDKDIVVFRGIDEYDFLTLNIGDIFQSNGYFSTSISATLITGGACESNNGAVMRIYVPKGKKCIYIPGREKELLFSHGIILQLTNISYNMYNCLTNDKFNTNNQIVLFDFAML